MKNKNQTRRQVRPTGTGSRRRGSVLILVIALLVLLALIGTAYLTTTQTERYTAAQNSVNTEGDLQVNGVVNTVGGLLANGLFAGVPTGSQYRPPSQEMPLPTVTYPVNFNNFDSTATNLLLGSRVPTNTDPRDFSSIIWSSISWPLAPDGSGNYVFDSPFGGRVNTYVAANRSKIVAIPYYGTFNGTIYPAMILFVPPGPNGTTIYLQTPSGSLAVPSTGLYLTPYGIQYGPVTYGTNGNVAQYLNYAGDASGTGVADSCFYKIPGGPINGVTYYAAVRVIDNNSAINASTALSMATDPGSPVTPGGNSLTAGANFGFFRAGVGLQEILNPNFGLTEMSYLNNYRELGQLPNTAPPGAVSPVPVDDPSVFGGPPTSTTSQYLYWSVGDLLEHQLVRRPGNPGYSSVTTQCKWPGPTETAAMAYKAGLIDPYTSPSILEQCLANDVYTFNGARSTPYAPNQVAPAGSGLFAYAAPSGTGYWFNDLYNYGTGGISGTAYTGLPLRTLLTADNAVSIATPSRLGNAGASSVPAWSQTTQYKFGDWVTLNDPTTGLPRSYVCVLANTGQVPPVGATYKVPTRYWTSEPFSTQPIKTSINTANFQQLYLGFAQVMTDSQNPSNAIPANVWEPPMKYPAATPEPQLPMFRSVLRNRTLPVLRPDQMLQLRAAQAAVNAMDLRDSDDNVSSAHITLLNTDGITPQYEVEVYGAEKQPYISEVFIHQEAPSAGGPNPGGPQPNTGPYMAVKLCNPYHTPITLTNWRFGIVNRTGTGVTMNTSVTIPTVTIPAANTAGVPGIIVLEDSAVNRPKDVDATMANNFLQYGQVGNPPTTAAPVDVSGLLTASFGNEMVLMRPRRADGKLSSSTDPADTYNEGNSTDPVGDLVPVDQLDMTGLIGPTVPGQAPTRFVYRRANRGDQGLHKGWNMIFPGNYATGTVQPIATAGAYGSKTSYYYYPNNAGVAQPCIVEDPTDAEACNLNAPDGFSADGESTSAPDPNASTYPTVPVQIANTFMAGPNPLNSNLTGNLFPFGGFARNGDMLQIPFIGSYRITSSQGTGNPLATHGPLVEINSVSMDSALANDNTLGTTSLNQPTLPWQTSGSTETMNASITEQIGRFCPIGNPLQGSPGANPVSTAGMDFFEPASTAQADINAAAQNWHYHWTRKLFDYFTVQCPADDYAPDVDPAGPNTFVTPLPIPAKYPNLDTTPNGLPVKPVANNNPAVTNDVTPGSSEDQLGIEGLININTAPWPVLASIAWVPVGTHLITYNMNGDSVTPTANVLVDDNTAIAQAIVAYRLKYGPFKSIEDLLKVPAISTEMQQFLQAAPGPAQGLFSPGGIGTTANPAITSGVRFDFSERFLLINRISNVVTTHSDNYTCYVLLQGWRNVDTSNPTLAVQRRAAFLVDRTNVNASNSKPTTFKIPTD
jgi:hypothetical protein